MKGDFLWLRRKPTVWLLMMLIKLLVSCQINVALLSLKRISTSIWIKNSSLEGLLMVSLKLILTRAFGLLLARINVWELNKEAKSLMKLFCLRDASALVLSLEELMERLCSCVAHQSSTFLQKRFLRFIALMWSMHTLNLDALRWSVVDKFQNLKSLKLITKFTTLNFSQEVTLLRWSFIMLAETTKQYPTLSQISLKLIKKKGLKLMECLKCN